MALPTPGEIAIPAIRKAIYACLKRRLNVEYEKIGHRHFFDVVDDSLMERIKGEMADAVRDISEELNIPGLRVKSVVFGDSEMCIDVECVQDPVCTFSFSY